MVMKKKFSKDSIPGFLTPWQAYSYERARRNFNQRIKNERLKWAKRYPELAEVDEKGRTYVLKIKGVVPNLNEVTLGDLRSKDQYSKLMEWMRYSKTPKYKRMRELQYRDAFVKLVKGAYLLTPEQMAEVEELQARLSVDDLIRFQLEAMPDDMQTVFDFYKTHMKTPGDADRYSEQTETLLANLREWAERSSPGKTRKPKRKARK